MLAAAKLRKSILAQIFSGARKQPENCDEHSTVSELKQLHSALGALTGRLLTRPRDAPSARMSPPISPNWLWVTALGHRSCGSLSPPCKHCERGAYPVQSSRFADDADWFLPVE